MIRLIAAVDNKRGIAKDGQIPWDLPSDKAHFRKLTLTHGANVLMGRTTYDSMGDYLESRHSYVVSHEPLNLAKNCTLVNDLNKFLRDFKQDLWIIGGAAIYEVTISYANEIYLTKIEADFNCDKFFPAYENFKLVSSEGPTNENGLSFYYQFLTRL